MNRYATMLMCALLVLAATVSAQAQDAQPVTVREIMAIEPQKLDSLNDLGENLTTGQIQALIRNELFGTKVQFTAVVLSNPRNSGLSSATNLFPTRIHIFVRDTSAASMGVEGMGVQIVDDKYQTTGTLNMAIGDVIGVVGTVAGFGTAIQITPETITLLGSYQNFGLPESILDAVSITTADVSTSFGGGQVQVNWNNLGDLRDQYVIVENATVLARDISDIGRPNFLVTTDGGETVLNFYDISLRYRNDRAGQYSPEEFNVRTSADGNFVPPPPGSKINLTGFINFQGDDPFGRGVPDGAILSINPFDDEHLELLESPPIISNVSTPDFVPGTDPVTITFDVEADPQRTIADVSLKYFTSSDPDTVTIAATAGDAPSYSAEIPAAGEGDFVTYFVEAVDNLGASSVSAVRSYRVLLGGITLIEHIQMTQDGGPGSSPFTGFTSAMDLTVIVQTSPGFGGSAVRGFAVQDDPDLGPWSGIIVRDSEALSADLQKGDVIRITEATVGELFGVTTLDNITYDKISSGAPLNFKEFTTDVLKDNSIAEAHEGMMVRFDNVTITNPDAGNGEWQFSSDGTTANALFADDASVDLSSSFARTTFFEGARVSFLQGVWWFSFSQFKLAPQDSSDIGEITNVGTEDEEVPGTFALHQNYPNPFNPQTSIRYAIPEAGAVSLRVFDMLGREVRVLVDGRQAPGVYDVMLDGTGLASGVYMYRLTAGDQVKTRSMLLLK